MGQVMHSISEQESRVSETKYTVERTESICHRIKADGVRHESFCREIATKLKEHKEVHTELARGIDAVKNYALMNDLHMESYLPLQIATVAVEVGMGAVLKDKLERYKKFCGNYISNLEKNCLRACDPSMDWLESRFRKWSYPAQESMVLESCRQDNIHLFSQTEENEAK